MIGKFETVHGAPPDERDREMAEKLATRVDKLGLAVPAVLFLEMGKPLSYIGSQAMVFFAPIATALFPGEGYNRLARFFENRDNVELLMQEIERLEDERQQKQKAARRGRPRRRWFGGRRADPANMKEDNEKESQ